MRLEQGLNEYSLSNIIKLKEWNLLSRVKSKHNVILAGREMHAQLANIDSALVKEFVEVLFDKEASDILLSFLTDDKLLEIAKTHIGSEKILRVMSKHSSTMDDRYYIFNTQWLIQNADTFTKLPDDIIIGLIYGSMDESLTRLVLSTIVATDPLRVRNLLNIKDKMFPNNTDKRKKLFSMIILSSDEAQVVLSSSDEAKATE